MKLFRTKENEYIVKTDSNKILYSSNMDRLILIMREVGVSYDEIEYGLSELIRNDHNVAEYGIGFSEKGPMFIFSQQLEN